MKIADLEDFWVGCGNQSVTFNPKERQQKIEIWQQKIQQLE